MARDLAALQVQLELQTAAFTRGMDRAVGQINRFDKRAQQSTKSLRVMEAGMRRVSRVAGTFVGILAAQFSTQGVRAALDYADAIGKTADKIGLSTESLQALRFAAEQSGVETRNLDMAMQRFARRTGEAVSGTGELVKTYQRLGINLRDANGQIKTTEELLVEYAAAIQKAGTSQEQLALAFKAFDSEGAALVNMLRDMNGGYDELIAKAREAGVVMEDVTIRKAERIKDLYSEIAASVKD